MKLLGILVPCFLLLFAATAWSTDEVPPPPPPPKHSTGPVRESEYFVITLRVYIQEDGSARSIEVLRTSPPMDLHIPRNKAFVESILSSARGWTFNPKQEQGKPVAGYAEIPVSVDLAEPFKIGGT